MGHAHDLDAGVQQRRMICRPISEPSRSSVAAKDSLKRTALLG
ncbi:hypothetical protein [Streptomyces reniochalinae]